MLINRTITSHLIKRLKPGKAIVLYGPRQVGKTTLAKRVQQQLDVELKVKSINADLIRYRRVLSSQDERKLQSLVKEQDLLIIDEAQRVSNIGLNLKILTDFFPKLRLLVTGSASLELANKIQEPLTGRKKVLYLYPISFIELKQHFGQFAAREQLSERLIYGSYPEVITLTTEQEKQDYLSNLVSSYLYKDVLELTDIKKSEKIVDLLRLLAFQLGHEVAVAELGQNLDLNQRTVSKYLDLLQKSFVIYQVRGFSRNLRKEIAQTSRYYFFDNGVRNALIENFNPPKLRDDIGQLWENFLMIERRKYLANQQERANHYFWRTYDQQEIDLIEERAGQISAFEFKWSPRRHPRQPRAFRKAYPQAKFQVVNRDNFVNFVQK
jgi:hypothetical protein